MLVCQPGQDQGAVTIAHCQQRGVGGQGGGLDGKHCCCHAWHQSCVGVWVCVGLWEVSQHMGIE